MEQPADSATRFFIGVVVVVALIIAGFVVLRRSATRQTPLLTPAPPAAVSGPAVTIGWMGPLTGDAASYGESIKRGVELAKQDLKADNISIVFEDSKCEGKEAASAINKLFSTDKVRAIIGEVCSGGTLAAAPIAEQNEVVLISAASTSPEITKAGEFIFRTVPSDALQGAFGAKLVFDAGHQTVAVLYSNEDYGVGFNKVLSEEFTKLGGTVATSEAFERTAVDMRTQLTKIAAKKPAAVYVISNSPDSAVAALKQITQLGIKAAIYGSEGLKSADIIKAAGEAAEGLIVTSVSGGTAEFVARHKEVYGQEPGPFAAQAYDAFVAVARAVEQGATTGAAIRDFLKTFEFEGASGYIKFDLSGDVAGNYDVLVVRGGAFVPLATGPAPSPALTPSPATTAIP